MNRICQSIVLVLTFILFPYVAYGNWNDPTLVVSKFRVALDTPFLISYYNAPSDAHIGIYPELGSLSDAVTRKSISEGSGKVSVSIPATGGSHGYYAVMYTETLSGDTILSSPLLICSDGKGGTLTLTPDKDVYSKGATMSVSYTNGPGCSGDRIVAYPLTYEVVPSTSLKYVSPAAESAVSGSEGSVSLRIMTAGYFNIYYFLEGTYNTVFDTKTVMFGTPATLSMTKMKFIPEEDVVISFTGMSNKCADWVGVFSSDSSVSSSIPIYRVDLQGRTNGTFNIPSGTLPVGSYKIAGFFNNTNACNTAISRFSVGSGSSSLSYVTDTTDTYYNIVSANDGLCMATDASDESTLKNMKLTDLESGNKSQMWKIVKRTDGKVDIINRQTGEYLLTRSVLSGDYNFTKLGMPDLSYKGWNIRLLDGLSQFSIYGEEEDGVTRYLSNAGIGNSVEPVQESAGTIYAWTFTSVETVETGISGNQIGENSVKCLNGRLLVSGDQDYTLWNSEGMSMNKDMNLLPGVYVVKWKKGQTLKVRVK